MPYFVQSPFPGQHIRFQSKAAARSYVMAQDSCFIRPPVEGERDRDTLECVWAQEENLWPEWAKQEAAILRRRGMWHD